MQKVVEASAAQGARSCRHCARCEVRGLAICAAMDDAELAALETMKTRTELRANEALVIEGDRKTRVFTLTSGMLRLSRLLPDGRRQVAGFLFPGDFLGLADDEICGQTAEAVVDSQLCSFSVAPMERLMERHPRLKDRLYVMTRTALRRARESQMMLGRLAPVEKLASFLLMNADRASQAGRRADVVDLTMTRSDIADFLGLTIETVSRSFTKLRARRLIRLSGPHHVEIVDRRALEAVAGLQGHLASRCG